MATPNKFVVDPVRIFEINGEVCTLQAAGVGIGIGNNQQIIAGTSGKKIRVMGWIVQSNTAGAHGVFALQTGAAGALLTSNISVPAADEPPMILPVVYSGYYETVTGDGLYVDVATDQVNFNIFYVSYTPA